MVWEWRRHLIPSHNSPLARRLGTADALAGLYALLVTLLDQLWFREDLVIHPQLHALLGTVLGLFLGFRTNTAYDRWWEGRKLWGQLVNDSRNLAIKARAFTKIDRESLLHFGRLVVTFARALKEHLREGVRPQDLSAYKMIAVEPKHVPGHIALQLRQAVSEWAQKGSIDRFEEMMLDRHITALMDICGGCERIRRTPLATSYRTFIRQGIALYLATLPWGLVYDFGFWTIPAVMMVTYFLVGVEMIAEEVEEPFGRSADDLMLDDLCKTIDATVSEILA
jgi:ion channel-forming bestrophin family protein